MKPTTLKMSHGQKYGCYLILLIPLCFILVTGCNYSTKKRNSAARNPEKPVTPSVSDTQTFADLQKKLITPDCLGCHNSQKRVGGVVLDTYAAIMSSKTSEGAPIVTKGSSAQSPLYQMVALGKMPPRGPAPDASLIAMLGAWINAGAEEQTAFSSNGKPSTDTKPGVIDQPPPSPSSPASPQPTTPIAGEPGRPPSPTVSEEKIAFAQLQKQIFTPHCIKCHQGSDAPNKVVLTSYEGLMKGGEGGKPTVIPGNPDKSLLVTVLENRSMPPTGGHIEEPLIAKLRSWIRKGALHD